MKPSHGLMELNANWRDRFGEIFNQAAAVYLVRVSSAGELEEPWPGSCDTYSYPPPPPPPHPSRKEKEELAEWERAADAARIECQAEKVNVRVIETFKGAPVDGWKEVVALIDIIEGAPREPISWEEGIPTYGAKVGSSFPWPCSDFQTVRRMSTSALYIVSTAQDPRVPTQPTYITHAFWADPSIPFLLEARRLGARPR